MPGRGLSIAQQRALEVSGRALSRGFTGVLESFETGDLSLWDAGSGDVTTSYSGLSAYDGDYFFVQNSATTNVWSYADGDLPYYAEPGDVMEFRSSTTGPGSSQRMYLGFGIQGTPGGDDEPDGGYAAGLWDDDNNNDYQIQIERFDSGSSTILAEEDGLSFTDDIWYRNEIRWGSDGNIELIVEEPDGTEVASVSATDTNYGKGGHGLRSQGSNGGSYDFIRVI